MVSANRLGHSPLSTPRPPAPEAAGVVRSPVAPAAPSTPSGTDTSRSLFEAPSPRPLVAGLSPASPRRTQDNDPADDTVAVIDGFDKDRTHGEQVSNVITANSSTRGSQIRELSAYSVDFAEMPLDTQIKYSTISFLNSTSENLEEIADQPGKIQVINQSQGSSKLDIVMGIWSPENPKAPNPSTNPEDLKALGEKLGLKPSDLKGLDAPAQARKIFQALVDRVETVTDGSQEVRDAKARHQRAVERLDKQGIFYVISAGNEGDELSLLKQKGITFGADFADPVLASERDNVLVIGAAENKKRMADFSTPSPFVFAAVDGTKIPVGSGQKADGTSFAAPQVTALIAEMRRKGFTPQQVRTVLREAARDTSAPREQEGLGIIDMDKAKKLIQRREKEWKQSPLELRLPVTVRP